MCSDCSSGRHDVLQVPTRETFPGHNRYSGPSIPGIQVPQDRYVPRTPDSWVPRSVPVRTPRGRSLKPLLLKPPRHAHETGAFAGVRLVPSFVGTLSPLFLLGLRLGTGRRSRVWLSTRGLRVPPWRSIGVPSGLVHILVLVQLAVRASSHPHGRWACGAQLLGL